MNLTALTLNNSADLAVVYAKAGLTHADYHAKEAASAAFRLHPEMREPMHIDDSECTVDPDTLLCMYCGVDHSEQCIDCGRRGFHSDTCPAMRSFEIEPHPNGGWRLTLTQGSQPAGGGFYPEDEYSEAVEFASEWAGR